MSGTSRRAFLADAAGALAGISLLPRTISMAPIRLAEPVRVGLVGVGRQGRAIITELQKLPDVTIGAVCDTSTSRLSAAQARAPGSRAVEDFRAVLDMEDIPGVIVASPTHLHREIVEAAIAAGRHVYCEAPLAATVEDCLAIATAAAGTSLVLHAGFQARSNPVYQRAHPLVQTELRDIISMEGHFHHKTSWRFPTVDPGMERNANWRLDPEVSSGLVGEVGSHQVDVALWYRENLPVTALGTGGVRFHRDGRVVPDTVHVDLRWPDGTSFHYDATLANSYGGRYEVFHGSNGAIKLADTHGWLFKEVDAPTQGWEVYATRQQFFQDEGIILIADATKLAAQGRLKDGIGLPYPPLYYALADFLRSVTEGTPVACSASDGAHSSIVGILANQAVLSGSAVGISIPE